MTNPGQWAVSKNKVCCFWTKHAMPVWDNKVVSFSAKTLSYVPLRVRGSG